MNKYLLNFIIAVPLLTGAMAGFNWWMDPYAIYRNYKSQEQESKPLLVMNERVFKTIRVAKDKADIVFLGTSRTDIGIGNEQPIFAGKRAINLATFGQPISESRRLMGLALNGTQPKIVVLGLDFFAFNTQFIPPPDYVEDNYSSFRPYSLLLSVSALADSWHVMRHKQPNEGDCCYSNGFRIPQDLTSLAGSYQSSFTLNEQMYLHKQYRPFPGCRFSFIEKSGGTSFDDFRAMIRLAHQQHLDFRLFISPSHARQWEIIAVEGLTNTWEEWKRGLVRVNEDEARRAAAQPFALWDFSGYDSISTEPVPAADDKATLMRWYSNSSHYTPALGKLIVQRMFTSTNTDLPDNWGVPLNATNLESHLTNLRTTQQIYRQTHAQDIAEIAATALTINQVKHCKSDPR